MTLALRLQQLAAIFFMMGLGACEEEDLCEGRPTQEFESEHFLYRTCLEPGVVGPEILFEMEGHLRVMQAYLGFDTSGIEFPIRYVAHPVASDYRAHFRVAHNLIDAGNQVMHEHELIHSYLSGYSRPVGFLEEGVATALTTEAVSFVLGQPQDWRDLLDQAVFLETNERSYDAYGRSRTFATYLFVNFGAGDFLAFYRAAPIGSSAKEVSTEFTQIYGRDLDEVWEAAMTARLETVPIWRCSAPLLDGESTELGAPGDERAARVIDVGVEGFRFELAGADLRLTNCFDPLAGARGPAAPILGAAPDFSNESLRRGYVDVPPGRYAISSLKALGAPAAVAESSQVSVDQPSRPWFSDFCESAEPLAIASDAPTQLAVFVNAGQVKFIRLQGESGARHRVAPPFNSLMDFELCRDCSDTSCWTRNSISIEDPILDLNEFPILRLRGDKVVDDFVAPSLVPVAAQ
jgi:hypothetical protein